ncbi:hypothetical protein AURDEDRAFT_116629 [Auricularia subglabra TFB-10046 SS5]|nr:hypothetical protein AURDEDRAFT_116629 [Auricularia subglabra TFB-10046 SS5]
MSPCRIPQAARLWPPPRHRLSGVPQRRVNQAYVIATAGGACGGQVMDSVLARRRVS